MTTRFSRVFRRVLSPAVPRLNPSSRCSRGTPSGPQLLAGSSLLLLGLLIGFPAVAYAEPPTCHITVFEGVANPVDCPANSLIATYKYRDGATLEGGFAASLPQTLFDSGTTAANVPPCGVAQADVITPGPVLPVIDAEHQYATAGRLLAHREVDAGECVEGSSTSTSNPPTPTSAPQAVKLARTGSSTAAWGALSGVLLMIGGGLLIAGIQVQRRAS